MCCLLSFSILIGGREGIVILVMIWDKIMQFFDCSKLFWPELSEFQEKKLKRIDSKKLSTSKEFELLATNRPI